jgi:hypothetical protein
MSVNNNVNHSNNFSFNDFALPNRRFRMPKAAMGQALDQISQILDRLSKQFEKLSNFNGNGFASGDGGCCCPGKPAPINPPRFDECHHPKNSLKTEGNVVTTPGGYKIEQQGQFNWKITGPDGKKTEIWGDPHVREGDGGAWDFKRNSVFKLPDGTQIKVNTVPYGNGMTVTGSLDITNGSDHIKVSDIDKGMGKIGQNQGDGILQRYGNDIAGMDTFVMGNEADDWSLGGKEIVGSNNGGDSFKLGNDLAPGRPTQNNFGDWSKLLQDLMRQVTGGNGWGNHNGFNNHHHPYRKPAVRQDQNVDTADNTNTRQEIMGGIRKGLRDLNKAINVLNRLANLSTRMDGFRNRGFYA